MEPFSLGASNPDALQDQRVETALNTIVGMCLTYRRVGTVAA